MGRYAYSIWPVVSFMPWFRRFDGDRVVISMINSVLAIHSCLRGHLGWIGIVESPMCVHGNMRQWTLYCGVARDLTPNGRNFGWT
jgi:hypothetical protein